MVLGNILLAIKILNTLSLNLSLIKLLLNLITNKCHEEKLIKFY